MGRRGGCGGHFFCKGSDCFELFVGEFVVMLSKRHFEILVIQFVTYLS